MAVFPDRIVLKNSADTDSAIRTAVGVGGTNAIGPGELVIGQRAGAAVLYTIEAGGSVVEVSTGPSSGAVGQVNGYTGEVYLYAKDLIDVRYDGDLLWNDVVTYVPGQGKIGPLTDLTAYGTALQTSLNASYTPNGWYKGSSVLLSDGALQISNGTSLGTTAFAIELRVFLPSTSTDCVFFSNQSSTTNYSYIFSYTDANGFLFEYWDNFSSQYKTESLLTASPNQLPKDEWVYILLQRRTQPDPEKISVWLQSESGTFATEEKNFTLQNNITQNSGAITIGARNSSGTFTDKSTFYIQDFRVTTDNYRNTNNPITFAAYGPETFYPYLYIEKDNTILKYDPTINSWVPGAAVGDLSDVDMVTTPPVTGNSIVYDGAEWVPGDPVKNLVDIQDVSYGTKNPEWNINISGSNVACGDDASYNATASGPNEWIGVSDIDKDGNDLESWFSQFNYNDSFSFYLNGTLIATANAVDAIPQAGSCRFIVRFSSSTIFNAIQAAGVSDVLSVQNNTNPYYVSNIPLDRQLLNYNLSTSNWEPISLPTVASGSSGPPTLGSTVTASPTLAGINGLYATDAALIADGFTHISALNGGDDTTGTVPTTTGGWDSDFNTVDYLGQGIASSLLFMGINTNGAVYATPTVAANPNPTGRSGNYITDSQNVALYVSWFSQDMVVYRCGYKRVTQDGTLWFVVRADMKMYGQSGGYPVETWFGQDGRIRSYWGAKVGTSPTMTASSTHQGIASGGANLISAGIGNGGDTRAEYSLVPGVVIPGLELGDLSNVNIASTPLDGEVLTWVGANSKWENGSADSLRVLLGIGEYASDSAAGTGGVAAGAMYYNTTASDYRIKSIPVIDGGNFDTGATNAYG